MERALRCALLNLVSDELSDKAAAKYIDMLEAVWRYASETGKQPCSELQPDLDLLQRKADFLLEDAKPYDMRICGRLKWSVVVTNDVITAKV